MKNNFDLRRNVRRQIRYSNQTTYNGIDDAITTIDRWRNEIIESSYSIRKIGKTML